jgi:RimJ/RimL family protein N-acetyltransferase
MDLAMHSGAVSLRRACEADIPEFVRFQSDPQSAHAAAFGAVNSSDVNTALWAQRLLDPEIETCTILSADQVVGYVGLYGRGADREITYWVDRAVWGRGIASAALRSFISAATFRPLVARVAADNVRSVRVLQKCGFRQVNTMSSFAEHRGAAIEEHIYQLD